MSLSFKTLSAGFFFLICHSILQSQSINFGASGLAGANISNPTSLDFGPNNKLYVAQQDGVIWEYEVSRDGAAPGSGAYTILNSNQISLIKNNTPNHNDDGTFNSSQTRQITGILTAGTVSNPILYVTSSDSRIGGGGGAGNDVNLDTNSGILSRLSWTGSVWEKVDLVRGLPRCEENHSTNGLDLFSSGGTTYLLIQQGGNTNSGAPSNNFAGSSEFYLAGAMLIVNLTQLEQMEAANGGPYLDNRTNNTPYVYDLPSLNDPDRLDINNTHPSFPYGPSHPLYNATIDLGDPFGGNNGLNQTFPENGGPVQIFSPGYRNAYDVVITADGRIFTGDNGPNGGWGGTPLIYDSNDQLKGTHYTTTYDPAVGDYITNEFNITNGGTHGDALHYVGTINDPNNTYYGGHPVPIRAFPDKAGVIKYEYNGNTWVENGSYDWSALITGVRGYFNTVFTMVDFPGDTRQGEYLANAEFSPKVNILDIVGSSTNGICEYTASNFDGAMQGDILTASFNGNINRYSLDTSGTTLLSKDNGFLNGFGNIPLDLIALGDNSVFPGTIWVVTYGADDITVFEPGDFGDCLQPGDPEYVATADYDGDGYTNDDEIDNGTNHCSAGSSPNDNDGDLISDLNDTDDDNDGIPDNQDVFVIDPQNGLTTNLPINYPFWNNDPGTGFFGLGFTGLMLDPSGNTDYLTQFDEYNLSFGGAGGKATVDAVSSGDALSGQNSQENAFQFGVNVNENSNPFTIHAKVETPFNGAPPLSGQSYGIFIGNGDQDNYLKVALMDGVSSGDNIYGFEIVNEINGISNSLSYDAPGLLQAAGVDIYISVDPASNSAQVFYSLNSGLDILPLGAVQNLPTSFLSASDNNGLAIGIIGTSGNSGSSFIATWDFVNITEDQPSSLIPSPNSMNFGTLAINSSPAEVNLEVSNQGSPSNGPIDMSQINFTGTNANLFSSSIILPLSVGPGAEKLIPVKLTPDGNPGTKTASLEITHSGDNSPLIIPLSAILEDPAQYVPLVRINVGSPTTVSASDGGPNWESNPSNGAYSGTNYSVNTGNNYPSGLQYANRDASVPAYIDATTFSGIFNRERYDPGTGEEMVFSIPLANGNYTVNLFMGNNYAGTSQPGARVFDVLLEGIVVQDNLDLVTQFGHQVAGMLSFQVTVSDGVLNIEFGHEVENPLINAIEVIGETVISNQAPVAVAAATPLTGEAPLDVTFTGSGSTDDTGITAYLWDFGDGNTDTTADPVYTYASEGSYTVTLTVTDAENLQDSDQLIIDVTAPAGNQAPVAIAAATPLTGEAPLDVTFTGSGSTDDTGITAYLWDFGDGNTDTTADPVYTYASEGSYTVTLTVTDAENLQDSDQLIIDVTADLPPALVANPVTIDFGIQTINGPTTQVDLDLFNNGGTGEDISISAMAFTGTDAVLFSHGETLPLDVIAQNSVILPISFTPDGNIGTKTASLEITHSGDNSPLIIPLSAILEDPAQNVPLVRINVGSPTTVSASDGGPNWESNPSNGAYSGTNYSVNTGNNYPSGLQYANRDASVPAYIDATTFSGIFNRERYDPGTGEEMVFSIPLANGNYTVNLFMGNYYAGTSQPGARVFDVLLEGIVVQDNLDLVAQFGHQVAGMLSFQVTVSDGVLNIEFGHEVENPLINAIEVIGETVISNQAPVAVAAATPLTGEAPLDVTFTGSGSTDDTGITAYLWDFGDGNTDTTADPVYTYASEGSYTVTLTVTDAENLQDSDQLIIDVTADLPPALVANPVTIDFGIQTINGPTTQVDLDLFNNGGTGEDISISAMAFTGTDAVLFSHGETLPLDVIAQNSVILPISFTPDGNIGTKSASLEITHSGDNSPLIIPLSAEIIDFPPFVLDPIADQFNQVGENSSLVLFASGGDPNENVTYSISDQPAGIDVEPTNGQLVGNIDPSALTGGPNNDGIHLVTVTATKPGSADATKQITWSVSGNSNNFWFDKNEDETYTARHECSFVQAGDKFYLFGGRENAQTLDVYDYTTNTWNSLVNSAPIEFNHFQAVEYQGLIWVIGAFKTNLFPTETPADYIWAFNPATQEWIQGPEIPSSRKRGSTGLVVYNGKFYILAGNTIGHDGGYVKWFDEYDPATGLWTELEDAPRERDHFHAAVINGKLYAASGRLSGGPGGVFGPVISEVDVYDFATQSWSTLTQNIPTPRAAAVVANFENKLVVSGGESLVSTNAFDVTEIYDPVSELWSVGEPLVHQRHGTQGIVSGQGIFVVGGSPNRGGGNQKNMEYYGQDNPTGISSVASNLNASSTEEFATGETKTITITNGGGNIGVFLSSLTLAGPDAGEFQIDSGNIPFKLIEANATHDIVISHTGIASNKSASLTISYNNSESLEIQLSVSNQAPVAIAAATPLTGEAPLDVTFTGSGSTDDTGITAYLWDFGDGNTDTTADPVYTYASEGSYTVTLTVTDAENLQDSDQLIIDVTADLPPALVANPVTIDFGIQTINGPTTQVDLDLFNNGGTGEDISISAMAFTGTDAVLFSHGETLPLDVIAQNSVILPISFTPDGNIGTKTASLEITHSGDNSPLIIPLSAILEDPAQYVPLVRINVGSPTTVSASDGGPNWESNPSNGAYSGTNYSVNTGNNYPSGLQYANRDASVPAYIDATTFSGIFNRERYDPGTGEEMVFSIPLANGNYTVNLFMGNNYAGTSQPGARVFDVLLEGIVVQDNLDLVTQFGHQVAGMLSFQVTVSDGVLNIEFGHEVENPLINAIEVIGETVISNQAPVAVAAATPLTGEAPLDVTFTGSGSTDDTGITAYLWDFGDGNTDTTADPVYTYASEGSYTVTLTVTDAENLQDSDQLIIDVTAPAGNQAPVAIAAATPLTGEAPLDVTFTGSGSTDDTGITAYLWDFGDGNTDTTADPVYTYASEGSYTVTLTVTDAENLQDSDQLIIDVTAPAGNQAPVAIAAATPLTGEAPLDVTFTGSGSTDDTGITAYLWDFGDGNTDTTADPVYTYASEGSYTVTLTVTDAENLQDSDQLIIDVTADLPPALVANPVTIDFGIQTINGPTTQVDLDLFNNGGTGEDISISAMAFTGTDAVLFSHGETLPLDVIAQNSVILPISFTPDGNIGTKTASLEITHSGDNSPLIIPLSAILEDPAQNVPLVRINVGSPTTVSASDGGPNWESNPSNGAYSGTNYSVNTGNNYPSGLQYANRDASVPAYIDATTFSGIFNRERYDPGTGEEMVFSIPLANGNYTVNLFMGNYYAGTSQPGARVFDVLLEGIVVQDNLDLVTQFGYRVAGMLSFQVTVSDGVLNIEFGHVVENPLVNAIEVIGTPVSGVTAKAGISGNPDQITRPGPATNLITISPNPADQETYIIIPNELSITGEAYIFSMDGRLVRSFSLGNLSNEVFSIPTYSLEEGLYILTIPFKDGTINRQKLIVTH